MSLSVPHVIVIGASNMIGASTVRSLLSLGYTVTATYHTNPALLNELLAIHPENLEVQPLNVEHTPSIDQLIRTASVKHAYITGLVYASGYIGDDDLKSADDVSYLDRMYIVNLRGAMLATSSFHAYLSQTSHSKSIVIVGSEAGIYGGNSIPIYAAMKGALIPYVKGMARHLASSSTRINLASPGIVDSGKNMSASTSFLQALPFSRAASPCEISDLILFLLSEKSSYISGSSISVSGGR